MGTVAFTKKWGNAPAVVGDVRVSCETALCWSKEGWVIPTCSESKCLLQRLHIARNLPDATLTPVGCRWSCIRVTLMCRPVMPMYDFSSQKKMTLSRFGGLVAALI